GVPLPVKYQHLTCPFRALVACCPQYRGETTTTAHEGSQVRWRGVAGRLDTRLQVGPPQQGPADDEEEQQRKDRGAVAAGDVDDDGHHSGTEQAGTPVGELVQAEVLGFASTGDQQGEQGTCQRLGATQDRADPQTQQDEQQRFARW